MVTTKVVIKDMQITDEFYTIEYVASELGLINRIRIPLDSPMDEDSVHGYIVKDMERLKDKIDELQKLKKRYVDFGFSLEI